MSKSNALWRWQDLCDAMNARGGASDGPDVHGVSIDSRTLVAGSLFIALDGSSGPILTAGKGAGHDGHDFVAQAAQRGAVAAMVHKEIKASIPLLRVDDTREGLWQLGTAARNRCEGVVFAVTGIERRDIAALGRPPLVFSRVYDSRIRSNPDFGPGWRLALDEQINLDGQDAAWYMDFSGARYHFRRRMDGHYVPEAMVPVLSGVRLIISQDGAVLAAANGEVRKFERISAEAGQFLLQEVGWSNRAWIRISRQDGRIQDVHDREGRVFRIERDATKRVASVIDRHQRRVTYEYDRSGRLARVRDLGGNTWSNKYDVRNRLTTILDSHGAPYFQTGYDVDGRVAWSIGQSEFAFDYGAGQTAVNDRKSGERHIFELTSDGVVVAFSSTTGIAWRLTHDAAGRVDKVVMSEIAARLSDDEARSFYPDGIAPAIDELGNDWNRLVHFRQPEDRLMTTETVSPRGREFRHYQYEEQGRLSRAWSSTGGIPAMQAEYGDVTSIRTGWDASHMEFEFQSAHDGTIILVDNGQTRIEIERDRSGGVRRLREGSKWISFGRDHLGRISEISDVEGTVARYYRDALGYRVLTEFSDGGRWRVAVDATGKLGNVDGVDRRPILSFRIPAMDHRAYRLHDHSLKLLDQLRISAINEQNDRQPYYGVIEFDGRTFAPRVHNPIKTGISGLEDALALAPLAANLLSGSESSARVAFESLASPSFPPLEHRRSMKLVQPRFIASRESNGQVPEIIVTAPRPQVLGYFTSSCIDQGTIYDTVEAACGSGWVNSYTEPGNGSTQCTSCDRSAPSFGRGGGGGGGGTPTTPPPSEEEKEDDCDGVTEIVAPTPDPQPSGVQSLSSATQVAYRCLADAVATNGGRLSLLSAYRSQSYQTHLLEVWNKFHIVQNWPETRCTQIRSNVYMEWTRHKLGYKPAEVSRHTSNTAFDASWGILNQGANIDTLAQGCGLSRPVPGDRWHFVLN